MYHLKIIDDELKAATERIDYSWKHILYSGGWLGNDIPLTEADSDDEITLKLCIICNKTHIPDGPPVSLPERDICGSNLPEWWPVESGVRVETTGIYYPSQPWSALINKLNEYTFYDEFSRGLKDDVQLDFELPRDWDKHYHEGSSWRAIGWPRQGWWKCRTKEEGGWDVEVRCKACHKPEDAKDTKKGKEKVEQHKAPKLGTVEWARFEKAKLEVFFNDLVAKGGEKDKQWCLDKWKEDPDWFLIKQEKAPDVEKEQLRDIWP